MNFRNFCAQGAVRFRMTRPLCLAPLFSALLLAAPLFAQDGIEIEGRATAGRALWRDAGEALRQGDSLTALARLDSAWHAWPFQSAYPRGFARLAGRLGLPDRALPALDALTAMGAAWDGADPAFARLATDPRYLAAAERNRAATAPLERSTVRWEVGVDSLLPEGVAYDSATGRLFISSLRWKKVLVRERDGRVHDFVAPGAGGVGCVLGMAIDRRRGLLWVASSDAGPITDYPEYNGTSALFAFDLRTGEFRYKVELPSAEGGHQLGDVVVTPKGTIFATDSRAPMIFTIPAGPVPRVAAVAASNAPLFRNLQGMVPNDDESALYVADYSQGLLRVDLRSREALPLLPPAGATLLGIDGMVAGGPGRLVAVQNGISPVRVVAIRLDRRGRGVAGVEVLDRPPLDPGEATLAFRSGSEVLYVATSPVRIRSLPLAP